MTFFKCSRLKEYLAIRRWQRTYQIKNHIQNIEAYFAKVNGYEISKASREASPNLALTYGEIDLESFLALLSMVRIQTDTIFYDLGCGLGKTVIACAHVYPVKCAFGVECLAELLTPAIEYAPSDPRIRFLHQDILDTDWTGADILFLNVATFIPECWHGLSLKLQTNPVETIITCGKSLDTLHHYDVRATQVKTSWGIIPAYIHTQDRSKLFSSFSDT